MNNILGEVLVGVSLAVTVALAVPLSLMTATIIRGESPRQLTEKEQTVDIDVENVQDLRHEDSEPEDDTGTESDPAEPDVQAPVEDDLDSAKPQVPPDPGPAPAVEPEPASEPAPEPEPEPVISIPAPVQKKTAPKKKSAAPAKSKAATTEPVTAEPVQQSKEPAPAPAEAVPPQPVQNPNEAPCMIEGLEGGTSVQSIQQTQPIVQQTNPQEIPSIMDSGYSYDVGNSVSPTVPSIIQDNGGSTDNTAASTAPSNPTETAPSQSAERTIYITGTGKRYHYDNSCNGGTYYASTLEEATRLGLTPCNKCVN